MTTASDIINWLQQAGAGAGKTLDELEVGIDDGGLALRTADGKACNEIGGVPEERCEQCDSACLTKQDNERSVVCDTCGHEQDVAGLCDDCHTPLCADCELCHSGCFLSAPSCKEVSTRA
jgi:hypothetical protein